MSDTTNVPQRITVQAVLSAEIPQRVGTAMVTVPAVAGISITGAQWQ